jgi:Ala-tRNA(Pro) deacylase
MKATRDDLFAHFEGLGVETSTVAHPPVFTVEESKKHRDGQEGAHCKNLFLKDKKGALWLVVTLEDRAIDMKELRHKIGSHHLSFGKPDLLMDILGVEPGSVTPFALINDIDSVLNVVLDAEMMGFEVLNYHPLSNTATTSIKPVDLLRFISSCGHEPTVVTL